MHLDCIDIEFRHEFRGRPRCGRASTLPSTRIAPARLSAATCAARSAAQPWPASSSPDSDVAGPEPSCFDVIQVEPAGFVTAPPRGIFPHVVLQPDSVRPTDKYDTSSKLLISISCSPRSASPTILSAEFSLSHPPLPTTCECLASDPLRSERPHFCVNSSSPPFFSPAFRQILNLPPRDNVLSSENPGADCSLYRSRQHS